MLDILGLSQAVLQPTEHCIKWFRASSDRESELAARRAAARFAHEARLRFDPTPYVSTRRERTLQEVEANAESLRIRGEEWLRHNDEKHRLKTGRKKEKCRWCRDFGDKTNKICRCNGYPQYMDFDSDND